jgi:hypothetical protein
MLIEKRTVPHVVKKYPAFHGNWNFLTVITVVRYLSLSWARLIQSAPSYFIFKINIILPSRLIPCLPSCLFRFPHKNSICILLLPVRVTCPAHLSLLQLIILIISGQQYTWWCSSLRSFLPYTVTAWAWKRGEIVPADATRHMEGVEV